ncbi:hypothetical protein C0Q70_11529 [Pomacea canaliculata]|uniref:Glycosyltransferase family 92 protein n=1 Tax=Pomacea canaliculata TaxID=400727 RepID=A0A2T7P679_POMCA|nr:hypothetical protein C0Q70_11529 [Pomacea canaliculata]
MHISRSSGRSGEAVADNNDRYDATNVSAGDEVTHVAVQGGNQAAQVSMADTEGFQEDEKKHSSQDEAACDEQLHPRSDLPQTGAEWNIHPEEEQDRKCHPEDPGHGTWAPVVGRTFSPPSLPNLRVLSSVENNMARCLCMEKSLLRRLYRKRIVRVFVIVVVVVVCGLRWRKQRESSEREISCMQLHLYSAHERTLDGAAMVTLVGLADRDNVSSTHVTCRFTVGKEEPESGGHWDTQGTILVLPEHHGERFGAILIDCPLHDVPTRPNFVSVVLNETDPYLHTVRITSPESGPPRLQMALCVPPIHGGYNRWEELIETLELLQLLGVDHAEMYLLDAGPNVTSVLNYYVTRGFLRLHTWPDPPQPVHYFGQLAAVNDCLLRMRNVAKLVMFADLDEVIVPHRHDSLSDMLQDVLKQQNDSDHVGAFNFLNSFFVPSNDSEAQSRLLQNSTLNSDQIRLADSLGLKAVSGVYHGKVFPFTERSKCIVDPLTVTMMQVHFVGIFSKGFRSVTVDPSISLLHHYRGREDKENLVPETSALKFVPELTRRVRVSGLALDFKQRTTMYSCGERIL